MDVALVLYIKFILDNNAKAVIGIDIDQNALIEAKRLLSNKENLYLVLMDAENMAFKSRSFDLICGVAILHHISLNKALPEISRVLNNDGLALFIEPLGHNPILNLFRKLTPKLREKKEHPLRKKTWIL
ncbi:MAG: class I SAM-dependent methyltransferase [candidate division WOR-3 bacterium]